MKWFRDWFRSETDLTPWFMIGAIVLTFGVLVTIRIRGAPVRCEEAQAHAAVLRTQHADTICETRCDEIESIRCAVFHAATHIVYQCYNDGCRIKR